jgi:hypothetical protein
MVFTTLHLATTPGHYTWPLHLAITTPGHYTNTGVDVFLQPDILLVRSTVPMLLVRSTVPMLLVRSTVPMWRELPGGSTHSSGETR